MSLESRVQRLEDRDCGHQFALLESQPGESREQTRQRAEALAARHPGQTSAMIIHRNREGNSHEEH